MPAQNMAGDLVAVRCECERPIIRVTDRIGCSDCGGSGYIVSVDSDGRACAKRCRCAPRHQPRRRAGRRPWRRRHFPDRGPASEFWWEK